MGREMVLLNGKHRGPRTAPTRTHHPRAKL